MTATKTHIYGYKAKQAYFGRDPTLHVVPEGRRLKRSELTFKASQRQNDFLKPFGLFALYPRPHWAGDYGVFR